jgi:prophage tail gpP-like protein
MTTPITIRINGEEFVDYKSASVSMDMEEFARSFTFDFSDKWIQNRSKPLPFHEDDECTVHIYGEKVIDGYIDNVEVDYGANRHRIAVAGYSWAQDLVKCSAIHKTGSWRNATILVIANAICEPFGCIASVADPSILPLVSTPFPKWSIESEETAFECINRMAKTLGLFLMTDGSRNLLIAKASTEVFPGELVFGRNIVDARRIGRWGDRHSFYLVKSQTAGDDTFFADQVGKNFHREDDEAVRRYRPLIIVSDGAGKLPELQTRAKWERNSRAGRSRRLLYTVKGFREEVTKRLWPVNKLVRVSDPMLDTQDNLITIGVNFTYARDGGETTSIEVGRAEAFDVLAPPPKKPKKKKGGFMSWE